MDYLIDGYNLAHWLARGRECSPAELRALLTEALARRVPGDARRVRIYWDVRNPSPLLPSREDLGWCTMHNVPDADEAIVDEVWGSDEPHRLVVVSRDREVCGRSRQLGARVAAPADLLGRR